MPIPQPIYIPNPADRLLDMLTMVIEEVEKPVNPDNYVISNPGPDPLFHRRNNRDEKAKQNV